MSSYMIASATDRVATSVNKISESFDRFVRAYERKSSAAHTSPINIYVNTDGVNSAQDIAEAVKTAINNKRVDSA
jgi:hypothetical protein